MHPDFEFPPWQPLLYFGSLVTLLTVSLKLWRKLGMPVLLPLGLGLVAFGFLPPFAISVLGIEAVWKAIGPFLGGTVIESRFMYDGQEVTPGFYILLAVTRLIQALGLFLSALALLAFARHRVTHAVEATARLHSPPSS